MPRRLLPPSSRLALISVAAGVLFAALAIFVPINLLLPVMNSICLGVVGAVTIVFAPLIGRLFQDREFDRVSQMICGMLLMWLSLLGSRLANLYVNVVGGHSADRIANSPVIAFLAYMAIIGGVLHMSAPGIVDSKWQHNKNTLKWAFISGVIIAITAICAQAMFHH